MTHYREVGEGIDGDSVENIAADWEVNLCLLLCDELNVKDGLVYDINTDRLVGYTDIDIDKNVDDKHGDKSRWYHHIVLVWATQISLAIIM